MDVPDPSKSEDCVKANVLERALPERWADSALRLRLGPRFSG